MDPHTEHQDFYKLINVSRTASEAEIRKAFRKRALDLHPDKNPGNEEMMKRLTMAKDTLLDPDKRQKYNDEHEDMGTEQDVSGYLHCGKRLSTKYKRQLVKYMKVFSELKVIDNFAVVFDTLANLNLQITELINTSVTTESQVISKSDEANDTEKLQGYFYDGQYISMAKYMMNNHCTSSSILTLYDKMAAGRNLSSTPPSFQAGLCLLKGQISVNDRKHNQSLEEFQKAVFTCPSDEIISAVNLLMTNVHLIAGSQLIMHELYKGEVTVAQSHKYQDRLNRTNHLRLISKFEKGVTRDAEMSCWDKALMYIDLTMAASGIALIHCFFVAMTYLLEEIIKNQQDLARVYAICNIISDLSIFVVVLARRYALPITELHFNKVAFITLRKAHEILRSKIQTYKTKTSLCKMIFGPKPTNTMMVKNKHIEIYKMMANSIFRLVKVTPFVNLQVTTVADMIYLDVISDRFVEDYYKTRSALEGIEDKNTFLHLYKYYLLECAWKMGNDSKFTMYREEAMKGLLEKNKWSPAEVEETMSWEAINRTEEGWLDTTQPWLNLPGTNYDSVYGILVDVEKGTFQLLCAQSPPERSGLFDVQDIMEIIYNGLNYSLFTLDPPDNDLQYHPFHQLKYAPKSLAHTNLLQTLLHADYLLKMISMGTEVSANTPHLFRNATKEGFLSLLPRILRAKLKPLSERRGGNKDENVHRFWIESDVLEYKCEEENDGKALRYMFGNCKMQVKTHLMKHNSEGELIDDSEEEEDESDEEEAEECNANMKKTEKVKKKRITAETEFANDFTECYNQAGYYFPILLRIRELMKLMTIQNILKNFYDKFENAKNGLKDYLTTKCHKVLKDVRKEIAYPQSNSRNVNRIYKNVLRDQRINESNLSSGEERRAKSLIKCELDKADEKTITNVTESLASAFEIFNSSHLTIKVRNWLNDGIFTSYTTEIADYLGQEVYPREYKKLDQFALYAASFGIHFSSEHDEENDNGKDNSLSTVEPYECPWVPAAFCSKDKRRVYGGVCILPRLHEVANVTNNQANNSFLRGSSNFLSGGPNGSGNGSNNNGTNKHGNWQGSNRAQHTYVIYKHNPGGNLYVNAKRDAREHPTLVYKVGVSHDVVYKRNRKGMPDRVGNSVRAQRQTDRLNRIYVDKQVKKAEKKGVNQQTIDQIKSYHKQNPVYTCQITERIPSGEDARRIVLASEREQTKHNVRSQQPVFNSNVLPGNKEPGTAKFKELICHM